MKIRTDFVTNSSSSCYTITLQIANTDGVTVSFKGDISAEGGGYFDQWDYGDPRVLAGASSVDELKQMLNAYGTLCEKRFDCSDKSILPDHGEFNENIEDDTSYEGVQKYWEKREQWEYDSFIQAVGICLKDPDDIKCVSLTCDGADFYGEHKIIEQYDYDKASRLLSVKQQAFIGGQDVTDMILDDNYVIDCGDDSLEFQFDLRDIISI